MSVKSVCVFCGSSNAVDPKYLEAAKRLGADFAKNDVRLVYGGGGIGLMGASAKACHDAGGDVLGIMPQFLRKREVIYDDVKTVIVQTMHERKKMMFEESDAFVVLPGGIGTLEEIVELISWRRLDLHFKPTVFMNTDGFWEPFFKLMDHTIDMKFTPTWLTETYTGVSEPEGVLPALNYMWQGAEIKRQKFSTGI